MTNTDKTNPDKMNTDKMNTDKTSPNKASRSDGATIAVGFNPRWWQTGSGGVASATAYMGGSFERSLRDALEIWHAGTVG